MSKQLGPLANADRHQHKEQYIRYFDRIAVLYASHQRESEAAKEKNDTSLQEQQEEGSEEEKERALMLQHRYSIFRDSSIRVFNPNLYPGILLFDNMKVEHAFVSEYYGPRRWRFILGTIIVLLFNIVEIYYNSQQFKYSIGLMWTGIGIRLFISLLTFLIALTQLLPKLTPWPIIIDVIQLCTMSLFALAQAVNEGLILQFVHRFPVSSVLLSFGIMLFLRPRFYVCAIYCLISSISYLAANITTTWNQGLVRPVFLWPTFHFLLHLILLLSLYLNELSARKAYISQRENSVEISLVAKEVNREQRLIDNLFPGKIARGIFGRREKRFSRKLNIALVSELINFEMYMSVTSPDQIAETLHYLFSYYDCLSRALNLDKVKTIGSSYICVGSAEDTAVENMVYLGVGMMRIVYLLNRLKKWNFSCRMGIVEGVTYHSVFGRELFSYEVFGPALKLATTLMESASRDCILVSLEVRNRTFRKFEYLDRGFNDITDHGRYQTFMLLCRDGDIPIVSTKDEQFMVVQEFVENEFELFGEQKGAKKNQILPTSEFKEEYYTEEAQEAVHAIVANHVSHKKILGFSYLSLAVERQFRSDAARKMFLYMVGSAVILELLYAVIIIATSQIVPKKYLKSAPLIITYIGMCLNIVFGIAHLIPLSHNFIVAHLLAVLTNLPLILSALTCFVSTDLVRNIFPIYAIICLVSINTSFGMMAIFRTIATVVFLAISLILYGVICRFVDYHLYISLIAAAIVLMYYSVRVDANLRRRFEEEDSHNLKDSTLLSARLRCHRLAKSCLPPAAVKCLQEKPARFITQTQSAIAVSLYVHGVDNLVERKCLEILDELYSVFDHVLLSEDITKVKSLYNKYTFALDNADDTMVRAAAVARKMIDQGIEALDAIRGDTVKANQLGDIYISGGISSGEICGYIQGYETYCYDAVAPAILESQVLCEKSSPLSVLFYEKNALSQLKENFTVNYGIVVDLPGKGQVECWELSPDVNKIMQYSQYHSDSVPSASDDSNFSPTTSITKPLHNNYNNNNNTKKKKKRKDTDLKVFYFSDMDEQNLKPPTM